MYLFLYPLIFLLTILSANASEFDIKAFGTIGAVYNDSDYYIYRKHSLQKDGSSKDLDFKTDTLLGLQVSNYFNDNYSIILQSIIKKDYQDKIKATIDWGYIKYDSQENFIFKVGKIRTPYYKNSDNLNIGYTNLMIREPIEVYGQVPFSSYNGVELIYSNVIDKYFYTIQANYGKENLVVPIHSVNQEVNVELDNLYAFNFTFGTNELQFRTTYLNADISASNDMLDQLFNGLRAFGLNELANRYELKDKNSEYLGFGLFANYNNFIFSSEYGQRKLPSFYGNLHGYYMTLGYSFDDFIPYISYSKSKMDEVTYEANTVSTELNYLLSIQNVAQSTKKIGFKYFLNENLDLKFQYEYITPQGDYGGFYIGDSKESKSLNVYSFALDFIF